MEKTEGGEELTEQAISTSTTQEQLQPTTGTVANEKPRQEDQCKSPSLPPPEASSADAVPQTCVHTSTTGTQPVIVKQSEKPGDLISQPSKSDDCSLPEAVVHQSETAQAAAPPVNAPNASPAIAEHPSGETGSSVNTPNSLPSADVKHSAETVQVAGPTANLSSSLPLSVVQQPAQTTEPVAPPPKPPSFPLSAGEQPDPAQTARLPVPPPKVPSPSVSVPAQPTRPETGKVAGSLKPDKQPQKSPGQSATLVNRGRQAAGVQLQASDQQESPAQSLTAASTTVTSTVGQSAPSATTSKPAPLLLSATHAIAQPLLTSPVQAIGQPLLPSGAPSVGQSLITHPTQLASGCQPLLTPPIQAVGQAQPQLTSPVLQTTSAVSTQSSTQPLLTPPAVGQSLLASNAPHLIGQPVLTSAGTQLIGQPVLCTVGPSGFSTANSSAANIVPASSGMPSFTGSINLTISNGAINLKPVGGGTVSTQAAVQSPPGTTVGKTNVRGPTLTRVISPTSPAVNLKIPSAPVIQMTPPGQSLMPSGKVVAPRTGPAVVIGPSISQIRPTPGTHIVPQTVTQLPAVLPQGTILPPGAKLVPFPTNINLQPQGGRLPLRGPQTLVRAAMPVTGQVMVASVPATIMSLATPQTAGHTSTAASSMTQMTAQPAVASIAIGTPHVTMTTPITTTSSTGSRLLPEIAPKPDASKKADSTAAKEGAKEGCDTKDDYDPAEAMEWKDGIGSLPGSPFKFRVNEFGVMEMVEGEETGDAAVKQLKKEDRLEHEGNQVRPILKEEETTVDIEQNTEFSSGDIRCCENCGLHGLASEFCQGGRFCSKSCIGSFASKKVAEISGKQSSAIGATNLTMKKSKHKRKLSPGEDRPDTKVMRTVKDEETDIKKLVVGSKKSRGFSWTSYLQQEEAQPAPAKAFKSAFPSCKNGFRVGMKLEGIDPRHPSLYCVLTVAEVKGYRLRLHFDGYSECHDFWVNADSPYIFPPGWSEKNGKKLQPPKGLTAENFTWHTYLTRLPKSGPAAPKNLFTNTQAASVTPHGFRVGMKLEAIDKKNSALTCVATVRDVLGDHILVHFDGWEDDYDYWCDPSSPYIKYVGWCQENAKPLSPPNDWPDIEGFTWEDYLKHTGSQQVPARAFKSRTPHLFEVGMKLEVVDKRNPILVRVASVVEVEPFRMKIHFDGWLDIYDYWVDDDCCDIHPQGWCAATGHSLTPPISCGCGLEDSCVMSVPSYYILSAPEDLAASPSQGGCPTVGCSGVGHIKGAKFAGHHSSFGCPYSALNMNKECALGDRLSQSRQSETTETVPPLTLKIPKTDLPQEKIASKCPTPGCDGSGHITGKYTSHHCLSGCPLAEKNQNKMLPSPVAPKKQRVKVPVLDDDGRPLIGPGSGRGRKKNKILALVQRQKELEAARATENGNNLHHGIHQSVFMSAMLPSPARDLPLCWEQHCKLLPGIDQHRANSVVSWTVDDVVDFVKMLPGCSELGQNFRDEQIDGEAFLLLNQADIVRILNVRLGPAIKIYNSILMCKNNQDM